MITRHPELGSDPSKRIGPGKGVPHLYWYHSLGLGVSGKKALNDFEKKKDF